MPAPRVAIVGRPNVGKSSLLNLIARERVSIVDPTPGVTRDRVSVLLDLEPPAGPDADSQPIKTIELTDTGGYGVYTAEGARFDEIGADLSTLTDDIEQQIAEAVRTADVILFAIDAQTGITPQDQQIATMLRERTFEADREEGRPPADIRLIATKVDGPSWEAHGYEIAALGFGEPLLCSAKTKYFRRDMLDRLWEIVPEATGEPEPEADIKIAIVGKRNAGKSTLVNQLAGQPRVIVSEIAGTTRDAVDVRFELDGRSIVAIDTAGLRRKKSFQNRVEWYALDRSQRAIARSDVVLLLIDAEAQISQVDEQLAKLVVEAHKPVVVVVNKWDIADGRADAQGRPATPDRYEAYIRRELQGLAFAPIAFMSAKDGLNVREVVDLAFEMHEQASARVGTGELNRIVRKIIDTRGPTNKLGSEARVYFATQVRANPPTIVLVVNDTRRFTHNYERFLMNRFREELPFAEVPIRLIMRDRSRVEKAAERRAKKSRLHEVDAETGGFNEELTAESIDPTALLDGLPDDAKAYFDD
ncbi:MAG: ribosome biogenesis GTPase Der [Planctomycetota bacterium]